MKMRQMVKEKDQNQNKQFMKQHIILPGKDYTLASSAFVHLVVC
jgi:hypothetical protein